MMRSHGMERSLARDKPLGRSAAVLSSAGSQILVLALRAGGEGENI